MEGIATNNDREIWREVEDDYYAPSIHVTASNAIGISVGGTVFVKPVREWHRLAMVDYEVERAFNQEPPPAAGLAPATRD